MRRRITAAIVGVTAIVLVVLGIPLAVAVQRDVKQSEMVELQSEAVRLLSEISVPLDRAELARLQPRDDDMTVTIYDNDGQRVTGPGPAIVDVTPGGTVSSADTVDPSNRLVVTTPITSRSDDRIVGTLLLGETSQQSTGRVWTAWAVMGAAAIVALGLAWLIARTVARRLSEPIQHLADMAAEIGDGRVVDTPAPSSIAEIDALGSTLATSSRQVHEVVARERRFSADVSHQLRTPLTHLRLTLEQAERDGDLRAAVDAGLTDVGRLEATVDHLLAFAREAVPSDGSVELSVTVEDAAKRWASAALAAGRRVDTTVEHGTLRVRANPAAIDQTLDVLLDNALRYGVGRVMIRARSIVGGGAVDVTDEGDAPLDDTVFERGTGNGHGIGLALARSMIEADGGRLLLTRRTPPTFSVVLLADT